MTGSDASSGRNGVAATGRQFVAGSELAGYRIESLLGRGGMGIVYRAYDLALDRDVAVKVLAPELAEDVRFRERFLRESRLAASLDHPAIVPIYEAGEVAGQLYIAMRLVEGTDLKRMLVEEGVLETGRALGLIEQIADALDAAHERGLVHRDVKPSNVLVDGRGHCYLADFGLSRRMAEQTVGPGGGQSFGTVDYAAPEQIRGDELDGRADLYSLGCLLYECLAGRPPFAGSSDTATVFAHLEREPPTLPGLEAVFAQALAKEPAHRYQSGRELVAAARVALQAEAGVGQKRRPERWLLAAAVVLAAASAVIGGVLASRGARPAHAGAELQSISLAPDAFNLIDAGTRRVVGKVGLGRPIPAANDASDVAFSAHAAWVLRGGDERVVRVDLATRKVTAVVRLPWVAGQRIATGGGLVWVTESPDAGSEIVAIGARSARIVRRFAVKGGAAGLGIAYGAGSLWLAITRGSELARIDPRDGHVLHRFPTLSSWVAFADGAVWVAHANDGLVWKIDPDANAIAARTKLHAWLSDLAVGGGFVWVSVVQDGVVYKLSEDDLSVLRTIQSGLDPERISAGGGGVWVANTAAKSVSVLQQGSGARTQLAARTEPTTVQFHGGLVWTGAAPELRPLPPIAGPELRISTPKSLMTTEPSHRGTMMDEQLSYATCANLLDYPDAAGQAGTRLRPEIAAVMPSLSADGRTYTFRIRAGFRFSPPSNEPVTAETFRDTIERALSPRPAQGWWPYVPDIAGAPAYLAGKAAHISGIAAHGATLSITLAKPAGDFLSRISMANFCPVPSGRLHPNGPTGPIPSTGPYYIASVEAHRIVLLPNPHYTGKRPRRLDRIVYRDDIPTPKAVALADRDQLDYLPLPLDDDPHPLLAPGEVLDQRYGPASAAARAGHQRYFRRRRPLIDTMVFNTRRPLFHDPQLRRSVSYALDRPALAAAYDDVPDDHVIPRAVPGYGADHDRLLGGPDLRSARRLADGRRRRAVLLAPCDPSLSPVAEIVRSDLARIGITVAIRRSDACDPRDVAKEFARADLLIGTGVGRGPTNLDPAPFLEGALTNGAWGSPLPPGPWNGPVFRQRLRQAAGLSGRARIQAYGRLQDQLLREAPFVVYGDFVYPEYFSPRVGCKLFPAAFYFVDLGALCIRKG